MEIGEGQVQGVMSFPRHPVVDDMGDVAVVVDDDVVVDVRRKEGKLRERGRSMFEKSEESI